MIRFIDTLLNKVTMYRLVLYELIGLLLVALTASAFGFLPYNPLYLLFSLVFIFASTWAVNAIFAYGFDAPSNFESSYITALILVLIITPATSLGDTTFLITASWAAAWASASKYLFAIKQKHLFNPAAIGVVIVALFLDQGASWWVGTPLMLPFVVVGGALITRKIRRFDMVFAFAAALVVTIVATSSSILATLTSSFLYAPALFMGTVMLTEPLTTPPTRFWRVWYAAVVGFLLAPHIHFGSLYFTPELALLTGNIFVYAVSPKVKLLLKLKTRIRLTPDTYEFVFASDRTLAFQPGQYLEWTLAHARADARGIRRYFTISSSPTDPDIRMGVKFYEPSSTFKKELLALRPGDGMVASQLAGDFTLPADKKRKLVLIAGGIGITPFCSMIEYLLEKKERRDIVLIYSARTLEDIAYVPLLERAERELGIRTIPVIVNQTPEMLAKNEFPSTLDEALIRSDIPDYSERSFYLSGPHGMVVAFSDMLRGLGISRRHIKKDFFPGFA